MLASRRVRIARSRWRTPPLTRRFAPTLRCAVRTVVGRGSYVDSCRLIPSMDATYSMCGSSFGSRRDRVCVQCVPIGSARLPVRALRLFRFADALNTWCVLPPHFLWLYQRFPLCSERHLTREHASPNGSPLEPASTTVQQHQEIWTAPSHSHPSDSASLRCHEHQKRCAERMQQLQTEVSSLRTSVSELRALFQLLERRVHCTATPTPSNATQPLTPAAASSNLTPPSTQPTTASRSQRTSDAARTDHKAAASAAGAPPRRAPTQHQSPPTGVFYTVPSQSAQQMLWIANAHHHSPFIPVQVSYVRI
jgi:hypothetical protein